ncbi:hypothetical protein Tco_0620944 [Tanacetum coccineum]
MGQLSAHVRLKKLEQDFEEYHNDMEMQKEEMEMKKQQLETEIGKLKNDTAFWKKCKDIFRVVCLLYFELNPNEMVDVDFEACRTRSSMYFGPSSTVGING